MAIERVVALEALAAAQHGLITTPQAIACLGVSRKGRWVGEGRLVSAQPGVFRVAGAPQSWHQALHAAALASAGVVSHRSAAALWGFGAPSHYVEVSLRPGGGPRLRPPAIGHPLGDADRERAVVHQGLPLTDPVRTILDLGRVIPPRSVRVALDTAVSMGLVTVRQAKDLRAALDRRHHHDRRLTALRGGAATDADRDLAAALPPRESAPGSSGLPPTAVSGRQ